MSFIKPAALFVCVALAGCAGKSDPASSVAMDSSAGKDKPVAQAQKQEAKPTAEQQGKQPVTSEPAKAKVAEEKSHWWSFGGKKKEVVPAAASKKVEVHKVTPAWLDDNEKRLKEAVAGSKFQVERRSEVLVVVAPADATFNPDRPHMLLPITLGPLSRIAKLVAGDPQNAVLILGHADSSGNAEDNRKLSLARAQSVASIFRMSGLRNDRLMLLGLGASKPLASNDNTKGRAQNRRVEILLTLRDNLARLATQNSR